MRMLGLSMLAAAAALAACAGPADPTAPETAMAYRTGSRVKQPDVIQPGMSYYTGEQLQQSPDNTVSGTFARWPATAVPPPPQ